MYNNQGQESEQDRSITKSEVTGNILTTVVRGSRSEVNRHLEAGAEDEHELSTFGRGIAH